jgi:hypothetical protein
MTILKTEMIIKSVTPKSSRITEIKYMDDILKRFSVEKILSKKEIRGCKETTKNESVQRLFS